MEFREVARKVFDSYGNGSYEDGLEVIVKARPEHPDEDATLTFWQACLLGMSGRPTEALEVLSAGLDRGLWWAGGQLADSDLDPVRSLPGWDGMLSRSERAAAQVARLRPDPLVRSATASTFDGTLITLHGAGADPKAHAELWGEATPESWTLITPAGNVPMPSGEWSWPFDLTVSPVGEQLESLELEPPMFLAGWSQGGGMAATLAWMGALEVEGLLLIGPGLRAEWDPETHRHVPTYMVIGETDLNLESCIKLRDMMRRQGVPVMLDELPGQGHELPENLGATIAAALDWLIGMSASSPRQTATRTPEQ